MDMQLDLDVLASAGYFDLLPLEICFSIILFCSAKDVGALCQTCHFWYHHKQSLWQILLNRDFPNFPNKQMEDNAFLYCCKAINWELLSKSRQQGIGYKKKKKIFSEGQWLHRRLNGYGFQINFDPKKGGYYEGQWRSGRPHGVGVRHYYDGNVYDGEWRDGMKAGVGIWISNGGAIKLIGERTANEKNGYGVCAEHGKYVYAGQWKKDNVNGLGVVTYNTGNSYKGTWQNGYHEGHGTIKWRNSSAKYKGAIGTKKRRKQYFCSIGQKPHGYGIYISSHGCTYAGRFIYGKYNGAALVTYVSQDKFLAKWKNDKPCRKGIYQCLCKDDYIDCFVSGQWYCKDRGCGSITLSKSYNFIGGWNIGKNTWKVSGSVQSTENETLYFRLVVSENLHNLIIKLNSK